MKLDAQNISLRARDAARLGAKLALQAALLYGGLTLAGFFGGGIGCYCLAAHFSHGGGIGLLAALAGLALGAVAGFFLAQMIIAGIIQDMMLGLGLKTGKIGYRKARQLLAEYRQRKLP